MTNIILCGGNGTRLWPISRALMPKQFVKLVNNKSLFQLTVNRNSAICENSIVVSNAEQYFLAIDQLSEDKVLESKKTKFLLEPLGRNTAPAIALACLALDSEEIVLVTPSDHLIKDTLKYNEAIQRAKSLAQDGYLVTFGILPTYPETGYGYINATGDKVHCFVEKPDIKTAQEYLKEGGYYWNSGMFCFKAGVFLEELQEYASDIYEASVVAFKQAKQDNMIRISHVDMEAIREESIDYAVMEKSLKVKMVSADMGWSDVGSFDALDLELAKDSDGNTATDNLYTIDAKDNFVYSSDRAIALADVEGLIVVDTPDALLVSKKGSSQKVKQIVKKLKENETELHHIHLTAHRPWGTYTVLEESDRYKIKRIVVKPGKRLSLQKHYHRSEHWIVVSGTAIVRVGENENLVRSNESTYIPMGALHRLENPGKVDLVLIEVQVGEYLGEDDIIRVEDDFERE